jgi:hypothetical protein
MIQEETCGFPVGDALETQHGLMAAPEYPRST